jgi:hypothetical protein
MALQDVEVVSHGNCTSEAGHHNSLVDQAFMRVTRIDVVARGSHAVRSMQVCRNKRWSPRVAICAASVVAMLAPSLASAGWFDGMQDPEDGAFDASRWLLDRKGFLPVPLVITEPAVGYGGGLGLVFFHRNDKVDGGQTQPGEPAPPSVSAILAAATENGTKFAGLGHLGIWRDNTMRYTGGLAAMSVNIKFYGGDNFPQLQNGVEYNLKGWAALQQLTWRIGKSNIWVGGQVIYVDASTKLNTDDAPPQFEQLKGDIKNGGVGLVLNYDGRDNIFTPNRGLQSEWKVREHWGEFANSFQYTEIEGRNRWYFEPAKRWILGVRMDVDYATDEVPFYAMPSIIQRGISRGRYQGDAVLATEAEGRFAFTNRWYGVAFAGVGAADHSFGDMSGSDARWAGGGGFRYLLARMIGLQVGLDVARGPEEWSFYIQIGSAWGGF